MTSKFENSSLIDKKALLVEFLGTLALTYASSWSLILNDLSSLSYLEVTIAYAFTLLVFTWIAFPISGAQFSPAITLTLAICSKKKDWPKALLFIIVQFAGGIFVSDFINKVLIVS